MTIGQINSRAEAVHPRNAFLSRPRRNTFPFSFRHGEKGIAIKASIRQRKGAFDSAPARSF